MGYVCGLHQAGNIIDSTPYLAVIRMSCPWFFEMRRLMRLRHANVTPNDAHDTLVLRRLPLRIAAPIAEFQYELESDTPHWLPDA